MATPEELLLAAARLRASRAALRSGQRALRAEALGLAWQGPAARTFAQVRLARRDHAVSDADHALSELATHLERAGHRLRETIAALGPGPRLVLGDEAPAVAALQRLLVATGHPPGAVDGCLGPRTAAAVRAFQRTHGLVVDGWVGPETALVLAVGADGPPARVGAR